MQNETGEILDPLNQESGDTDGTLDQQQGDEQSSDESVEELKERLAKAEELAINYKIRAEKAEKAKPKTEKVEKPEVKGELSSRDIIAITKANINDDDLDEVLDYAKFKKVTVMEALKSSTVKALLAEKEEQRNVANATNVGTSKRTTSQPSDQTLLAKARKGEMPETDEDFARLVAARRKK